MSQHMPKMLPRYCQAKSSTMRPLIISFAYSIVLLHVRYEKIWTPNASVLKVQTMIKQDSGSNTARWSLDATLRSYRRSNDRSLRLLANDLPAYQGCHTCQLMGQTVDKALESAQVDIPERLSWMSRTQDEENQGQPLSQQQTNGKDCGMYLPFNAYCLSRSLNPCQKSAMPDEWRLRWAQQRSTLGRSPSQVGLASGISRISMTTEIAAGSRTRLEVLTRFA